MCSPVFGSGFACRQRIDAEKAPLFIAPRRQFYFMVQMQDLLAKTFRDFREGSIVKGRVLEIRPREVLVDIGYKSEGVIPSAEFDNIDTLEVGDEVDVLLERLENDEGMVVLSKEKAAY